MKFKDLPSNVAVDVIRKPFDVVAVSKFLRLDQSKAVSFDTETVNLMWERVLERYKPNPSENLTLDTLWKDFVKPDPDHLAFFNGLLQEVGQPTKEKMGIAQFRSICGNGKGMKKWAFRNALEPQRCRVSCVQMCTHDKETDTYRVVVIQINKTTFEPAKKLIQKLEGKILLMQNGGFDIRHVLHSFGVLLKNFIIDTRLSFPLITAHVPNAKASLKDQCSYFNLGPAFSKSEESPLEIDWANTRNPEHYNYAIRDVIALFPLWRKHRKRAEELGVLGVCNIEFSIVWKLAYAEYRGINIDQDAVREELAKFKQREQELYKELGNPFDNIAEKSKVLEWINQTYDVQMDSIEKKKFYASRELMENKELRSTMEKVIELSSVATQISYIEPLLESPTYHPTYFSIPSFSTAFGERQSGGTATGRMSSGIHITPKSRRKFFVPRPGHKFLCADYNALEFWVTAELSGDPTMLGLEANNKDPHTLLASTIFGTTYDELNQKVKNKEALAVQQRFIAKMGNFGFIFGMWYTSFIIRLEASTEGNIKLTDSGAEDVMNGFYNLYTTLKQWQDRAHAKGSVDGYVTTKEGRRRYWNREDYLRRCEFKRNQGWFVAEPKPFVLDGVRYADLEQMERWTDKGSKGWRNLCLNTPIQGTAADGFKYAISLVPDWLEQVIFHHDAIVAECPDDRIEEGKKALEEAMVKGMRRYIKRAKVAVEINVSSSWKED